MPDNAKIVQFVELTSATLSQAQQLLKTAEDRSAAYAARVPGAVQQLIISGAITKEAAAQASALLADPLQALEQLVKLAAAKPATESLAPAMGHPVNQKNASQTSPRGQRQPSQRDLDFVRAFGLPDTFA